MTHNDIPFNYLHCFATNEQCAHCESCLHAYVTQFPEMELSPVRAVHPLYINSVVAKGNVCKYYQEKKLEKYGKGFTHMLDNIPLKAARAIECHIQGLYSSRSSYFRARRGETLIDAKTQKRIAALFRKEGITTAPAYDEVVENYKWF